MADLISLCSILASCSVLSPRISNSLTFENVVGDLPDVLLLEDGASVLVLDDFALSKMDGYHEVAPVGVLHDNAQALRVLVVERLLVLDYVGAAHRRQNPDLVQSVYFVLLWKVSDIDLSFIPKYFFKSINLPVEFPSAFMHSRKCTLSQLVFNIEIAQRHSIN